MVRINWTFQAKEDLKSIDERRRGNESAYRRQGVDHVYPIFPTEKRVRPHPAREGNFAIAGQRDEQKTHRRSPVHQPVYG